MIKSISDRVLFFHQIDSLAKIFATARDNSTRNNLAYHFEKELEHFSVIDH